jgi:photosystem II stability/assembly factor-like uncharacterized protein
VIYAATAGGVFRTADGGATWRNVSGPVSTPIVLAVAGENLVYAASDTAVYKTTNGGASWTRIGEDLPSPLDVSALVVDPRDANVVYVGSACQPFFSGAPRPQWHEAGGVFKSVDGGETFVEKSAGLSAFQRCVEGLALDPLKPDTLYAIPVYSDDGFARSDDGGETWTRAATILPGRDVIADPRDPNRRYGSPVRAFGVTTLLTSADAGLTWTAVQTRQLETGETVRWSAGSLALDPTTGRLFLGGETGAFRSGDGGRSVLALGGAARETVYDVLVDRTSGAVTIGTETGVYQSPTFPWNDWTPLPLGDTSLSMRHVVPSQREAATAYASSGPRIYATRDNGLTWMQLPGFNDTVGVHDLTVDVDENLYALIRRGSAERVYKLAAGSTEWVELPSPNGYFSSIYADPGTAGVVYVAATSGFNVTRDGGASWGFVLAPSPANPRELRIDPNDGAVFYSHTSNGIYKSTNGGHTWSKRLDVNSEGVFDLSRADGRTIYFAGDVADALQERAIYRSSDGGDTWTKYPMPEDSAPLSIVADPRDPRTAYLSTNAGAVLRTRDGGETWQAIGSGWPNNLGGWLAVNRDATVLHAATWRGMWELSLTPERRRAVTPR